MLAIGSPLGLDGSVTAGIVSALNRTIDESSDDNSPQDPFGQGQPQQSTSPTATIAGAIQTDAAINPGNSGGALVNTNGEVVGINTAIATNGGADGNIGVGFAIPSNRAKQVADDIIKGVTVSHPQLGVGVDDGRRQRRCARRLGHRRQRGRQGRAEGRRRDHRIQRQGGAHVRRPAERCPAGTVGTSVPADRVTQRLAADDQRDARRGEVA